MCASLFKVVVLDWYNVNKNTGVTFLGKVWSFVSHRNPQFLRILKTKNHGFGRKPQFSTESTFLSEPSTGKHHIA